MNGSIWTLRTAGYEILSSAGRYCRALIDGRDVLLRWTGEEWIQV